MTDLRKADEFQCSVTIDGYRCKLKLNDDLIICTYDQLATISKEMQVRLAHDRMMRKKEELRCQNTTNDSTNSEKD